MTARIPANINYYDAAVIDTLPAGIDPATLTTVSVTCAAACSVPGTPLAQAAGPGGARMVGWLLGDIASAPVVRTVTVTYTAVVRDLASSTRGTTLTNSATVRWNLTNGADPSSAGATWDRSSTVAAATVTVLEPHVLLTKAVADSTPEPGQVYGYTVTASNTGAANLSTAYDVVVTDSVPVGVVVDPATISDGGSLTGAGPGGGGTVTWTLPSLAVGATSTLRYSATLAPSASLTTATLTNSVDAVYRSLPGAGRAYDDVTPATAAVTPAFPRITATKAALTTGPAYIASPFGWALTLTNTGAGTAYGVDGVDTLPLNWRYTAGSASVSVNGAAAQAIEPALSLDGSGRQVLTWANLGDLPPGTAIVITITTVPLNSPPVSVVTAPGIGESVPQVNTLAASAADATGATGNASGPYHAGPATASTRIDAADLTIMKSVSTPFVAGSGGAWSLTVSNLGPDTAVGPFTVTDVVPAGLGFVAAAGTGWSCAYNLGSGTLTCSRTIAGDTLTSGQSFPPITLSVSVAAAVADGTTYVNTATVQGRTYDLVPANNSSTSTATVAALADLAIVKALSGPLVAGQDATYTLDVTNLGPSVAAAPVRVMDTLPTGSSFVSGTGTGWTCNVTGAVGSQTITCDRAALATGAAPQITVVIAVPASQTAAVVNTALVSSPTTDPVPGNNSSTVTSTPGASADLVLTKAHVGQIVAGQPATYRFTTTNDGPSDAAGVLQIVDRLPAGVTFSAVAVADGWTCSVAIADQQLMTCLRAAGLSAGATTVLDVTVAVASDVTGNVHNSATVSSPTPDPLPGNNTATDDSTATRLADLAITKTATGPATAGLTAGFTITVRNLGPSSALAPVTVTDVLPAGLTYAASSSAAGDGWSCAYTVVSRAITCTTGALAAGATAPPITVTTDVDSDAGPAVITNTATVSSPTTDPVPGNNSSSADLTVVDHANVSIVKSLVGTSPVVAGTSTSFHLAVANDGPSDADAIVVNDTLPAGLAPTTAMGTGWSCTVLSQVVTCTRATLAARGSAPDITVTADVSASVPEGTTLTNTGTVSTTTPGDDPADNTSTVQVPVHAVADLTLVKSHLGAGVSAGGSVTYVLQAHNDGPSNAVAPINVVDTLPPGFTYLSSQSGWSCVPAVPDPTGQVVTCTLEATTGLAAGADAALLTMLVHVAPQQDPGSYRNDAIVSSPTDDPVTGNNSAHDTVTVSTGADLSIVKTHTGPVRVGDQLRFTLTVTNSGPSQARDVVVADTMPSGLTYVSASGTGWTCALAVGSQVRCTIPALDSGAVALIDVVTTVQAAAYPSTSNIATVASGTPDPDPTDNTSTDTVTVPPLVDLAITKSHTGPARVGHQLTYTVHVSNAGPTDDPGPVTVTDTLPAGLSYVAATSPGWSCADVGQVVTCTMDTGLTAGGSANLRLVVDVLAAAYPSVVNTAAVTSPAEDTDPSNNAAVDPTVVTPQVSLALSKSLAAVDVSTATASWLLTVTNLGPNATVSPVVVVDTLPAQLTYRSYSGVGWTCAAVAQVVTCVHVGTVATHDSASVSLVTAYDAAVGTTVRNAAEIAAGSVDDQNPADDAASATLVIPGGTGPLPHTGADVVSYALLGMVLLMLGAALRLAGRRRPGEIA
ncbi:MAG: LPXTG cell wall anchor domain-containing protein [Candidatus Nanopelagicales bacterium]